MLPYDNFKDALYNCGIISHLDYVREFNKNNWTDIWLNTANNIVNFDSKYVMFISSELEGETTILYHPNLQMILNNIDEKMIKNQIVKGYDTKRNRVHVHYLGDGIIRIGNVSNGPLIFQFEIPTFEDLLKKKDYYYFINSLNSTERHNEIQGLLIGLGLSMGYKVKVAKNDRKGIHKNTPLQELATLTIEDLQIKNLNERKSKNSIDRIDVIWYDDVSNRVVAAFEVEFSYDYDSAYMRLGELNYHCTEYVSSIYSIIVGESAAYSTANERSRMQVVKQNFLKNKLCYLPMEKLAESLLIKDNLGFGQHIQTQRDVFFNKKLIQINKGLIH